MEASLEQEFQVGVSSETSIWCKKAPAIASLAHGKAKLF